ncbi:hypothetical protein F4V44_18260 [Niallia endozanthoxylica]|uniref:Uncharacterized protein n=2 Tax=Niallia endozanthoxylica TaxID=2036016 RepID=A0A5J5HKI2_9BACI|nr:hypothetical protein F4V44_18260 [Niallia endozanthoxylica]
MKRNKTQLRLLQMIFLINSVIIIPIILRKRPIKDWIIVYLFNAVTNGMIDRILAKNKIIRYPVRLFSKIFDTNILFDYFLYPTFTVLYNQWTYKDNVLQMIYKLFLLLLPSFFIELWAERRTDYIVWSRKWKWYHTFFSLMLKSLFTRSIIGIIRKIDHMGFQRN